MSRRYTILCVLSLVMVCRTFPLSAQLQPELFTPIEADFINPAYTDESSESAVSLFSTYQIGAASVQLGLTAGALWSGTTNEHHYGLSFRYSGLSFAQLYDVEGRYGYTWTIDGEHRLAVGGLLQLNASALFTRPDFGVGLCYQYGGWTVGVSARNLIGPAWCDSTSMIMHERRVYTYADYMVNIANVVTLVPHLLLWYGSHSIGMDLGVRAQVPLMQYTPAVRSVYAGYTLRGASFVHVVEVGINFPSVTIAGAWLIPSFTSSQVAQLQLTYRW